MKGKKIMGNGITSIVLGVAAIGAILLVGLPFATGDCKWGKSVEHPQNVVAQTNQTKKVVVQTNPKTNTVHYLSLEFKQSSFTLSIGQHIRDAANAFSITIPTTKEFYNSVSVGDELGSKFKGASFILSGNIGKRKVIVKDKFTRKE